MLLIFVADKNLVPLKEANGYINATFVNVCHNFN